MIINRNINITWRQLCSRWNDKISNRIKDQKKEIFHWCIIHPRIFKQKKKLENSMSIRWGFLWWSTKEDQGKSHFPSARSTSQPAYIYYFQILNKVQKYIYIYPKYKFCRKICPFWSTAWHSNLFKDTLIST